MSLDPAVAAVRLAVRRELVDVGDQPVLVACSGGADSLALLAATVFGDEEAALSETDPAAFGLDAASFRWRDRGAGPAELAAARQRLHAIGSCSFFEPVEELHSLGMLPL